jgi:hypothetical protein
MIGPTGMYGIYQSGWPKNPTEIKVTQIEKDSPASGGDLKAGDFIIGFGKEKFERHPLWDLADAIEQAEGSDGIQPLLLKSGKQVKINLLPLVPYSATAPYNCSKTDRMITRAADLLIKGDVGGGAIKTGLLGLMAELRNRC